MLSSSRSSWSWPHTRFSRTAHSDLRCSDLRRIRHHRIVARYWRAGLTLPLLILHEWCSFVPEATLVASRISQTGRSDRTAILWGKFARLQEAETLFCRNRGSVVVADTLAGVFVRVYEAKCCQGDIRRAALRSWARRDLSS
jgi:hypothetical protein